MDIIGRREAKEKGFKTYFTGQPCKHGHVTYRYTQSGTCAECINGDHKRVVDPMVAARRAARAELVQGRFRIFDVDRDTFAASVWAMAAMRYPVLGMGDVDPHLIASNRASGTGMHAFYCHPDDVAALRALAADMVKARPANVGMHRQELLRQLDAAANVDTAPEWRP